MPYRWQTADFAQLCNDTLYTLLQLRQEVFVVEQACIYQDLDNLDQLATHMLCWEGGTLRAYQRCLRPGLSFRRSSTSCWACSPSTRWATNTTRTASCTNRWSIVRRRGGQTESNLQQEGDRPVVGQAHLHGRPERPGSHGGVAILEAAQHISVE